MAKVVIRCLQCEEEHVCDAPDEILEVPELERPRDGQGQPMFDTPLCAHCQWILDEMDRIKLKTGRDPLTGDFIN